MIHPYDVPVPIHMGSMAPKGQELCGEISDGLHLTCMVPERPEVILDNVKRGFDKRTDGKNWNDFEVITMVAVALTETAEQAQGSMYPLKTQLGLYIGGMGAKSKNFYKEYLSRAGFEEECEKIQDLWLGGDKQAAIAAVPDDMINTLYLVGTKEQITERFQVWKESPVTTMMVGAIQPEAIKLLAELNA